MKTVRISTALIRKTAYLFLTLPVLVFYALWLKWYFALVACGLLIAAIFFAFKGEKEIGGCLELPVATLLVLAFLCIVWVYASGIGGWVWQRPDWNARNALLHDLINEGWPVVFGDGAGLTYYLCYWMIPALVGKLLGWNGANIALFIWTVIGILLVTLLLLNLFKDMDGRLGGGRSYAIFAFLVLWGGLNLIGQIIVFLKGKGTMSPDAIYGWSEYQYTPNNGLLEWVFNQSVPSWICAALFLNERKSGGAVKYGLILMMLIPFAPFAAIGMAPLIALDAAICRDKKIFGLPAILGGLSVLPVFWVYYGSNSAMSSADGQAVLSLYRLEYFDPLYNVLVLLIFLTIQVLIYAALIFERNRRDVFLIGTVVWLLLIPLIKIGPTRDFMLRGSIVPLFILMTYIIDTLFDEGFRKHKLAFAALLLATIIGFYSGAGDFVLTAINTVDPETPNVADGLGTMNIKDNEAWEIYTKGSSYIVENAGESFFFKYLAK